MRTTHWIRLGATLGVTVAAVAWVLWGVDPAEVLNELGQVSWIRIGSACALVAASFGLRVARFQLLLAGVRPPLIRLVVASGLGYLALNLLPLRLGEFVRPLVLEQDGVPLGRSIGAVALERVADLLALLTMILLSSWVFPLPRAVLVGDVDVLQAGRAVAGVASAGLLGLLLLVGVLGPRIAALLSGFPLVGPALSGLAARVAESIAALAARPGSALLVATCTAAIWSCTVGSAAVLLAGFPTLPPDPQAALHVTTITVAGTLAVPTPGMVGSFEAFAQAALWGWSAPIEAATAFAGLWHGIQFGVHAAVGLAVLAVEGATVAAVLRQASRARLGAS